jgi:hypothetical protein
VNDENVLLELEVYNNSLMYSCGDWSNGQNLIWFICIIMHWYFMQISIPKSNFTDRDTLQRQLQKACIQVWKF